MRGAGRSRSRLAVYAIVAGVALIVAAGLLSTLFVPQWSLFEKNTVVAEMPVALPPDRVGLIMVRGQKAHSCRRILFDNVSGSLKEVGQGPCPNEDDSGAQARARVGSLRDSFSKKH
jgi:hypothetical protein